MTKHDAKMFALYLIAIALGVQMMTGRDPWLTAIGLFQVCFVAAFFAKRLYRLFGLKD